MSDPTVTDPELEALMAELESATEAAPTSAPTPAPAPAPAPVTLKTEVEVLADEGEAELAAFEAKAAKEAEAKKLKDEQDAKELAEAKAQMLAKQELKRKQIEAEKGTQAPAAQNEPEPEPEKVEVVKPPLPTPAAVAAPAPSRQSEPLPPTVTGLAHYVDTAKFRAETAYSEANLDQAMFEQAGLRAYYNTLAAKAEGQHGRMKVKFDVIEATLFDHHRKAFAADPAIKVTEKMVENAVKMDPRWLKAKNLVIESEEIAAINKGLAISLADRKDMIVQLGADRREEFKGGVRIIAAENDATDLKSRALQAGRKAFG